MPIKIHHGPPGSYKTAGAMSDDFLREARAGRIIVTNVRGVSRERTLEEFPDLPDSFDVIWVDDKTEEGRALWAKWFHWVPNGAFIFLDEVQDLWPKRWKESDIRALDYPGGLDKALADNRPKDWEQAFDKHRHYNWDMVLTTPKYNKLRDDVCGVAEMAYKHKNLALIGWSGRYIEAAHLADDNGSSPSHFLTINQKKVAPYVFRIYDSTATGHVTDTKTGFNLFKNPRVSFLLLVLFGAVAYGLSKPSVKMFPGANPAPVKSAENSVPSSQAPVNQVSGVVTGVNSNGQSGQAAPLTPFEGEGVFINAALRIGTSWRYSIAYAGSDFTSSQLEDMGYYVIPHGSCGVLLRKAHWEKMVTCGVVPDRSTSSKTPVAVNNDKQVSLQPS